MYLCPRTFFHKPEPNGVIIMGNLLYIVALFLVIGWLVGFVGYSAGGLIHVLLVIAVIAILLQVIQGKRYT